MKRAITIVVAVLMISGLTYAQGVEPAVRAGAKSLNFTFGGFGSFGAGAAGIDGGISGSYFLSQSSALRIGLQVASASQTTPWQFTTPGSDGKRSVFSLGVGLDYLSYMSALTPRVRPYIGLGVGFTLQSSSVKPTLPSPVPPGSLTETTGSVGGDGTSIGALGILGAEFFLYPEISLSAEYQLNLFTLTSSANTVQSYQGQPSVTTKNGSMTQILGFGSAGVGLHIYF